MRRLNDLRPFSWIEEGIDQRSEQSRTVLVSHIIPKSFPAYCKLFHPIFVDESIDDPSVTWHEWERTHRELANTRTPAPGLSDVLSGGTLERGWPRGPVEGRRIFWRELAAECQLEFHADINASSFTRVFPGGSWPRRLVGPLEGDFDPETCARVVDALSSCAGSQQCFFYYWFLATRGRNESLLFKGDVLGVVDLLNGGRDEVEGPPTYWWPLDRSWCICTDYDLTFTLIGGSRKLVDNLVSDEMLECLEVDPTSRVDSESDQLNKPDSS